MTDQNDVGGRAARWRLIWTVAGKNLIDGLKHRQTLNHLLTTVALVALYRFLPDNGSVLYIALGLLIVMGLMGMIVTPQLIVEEKTNRTIEALRISPITEAELLTAKVIVGVVYCILTSSVVFAAYGNLVLHWWAMSGAILCGAFFIVSIGLLMGIRLNDVRQINLWAFIIFQPLIVSMILGIFEPVSAGLRSAMHWFSTVAMGKAAAQSIAANLDLAFYFQSVLIMLVWGLAFFLVVAWLLRRMQQ